ncbi:unnamed protein product, partial [Allacma fusca]
DLKTFGFKSIDHNNLVNSEFKDMRDDMWKRCRLPQRADEVPLTVFYDRYPELHEAERNLYNIQSSLNVRKAKCFSPRGKRIRDLANLIDNWCTSSRCVRAAPVHNVYQSPFQDSRDYIPAFNPYYLDNAIRFLKGNGVHGVTTPCVTTLNANSITPFGFSEQTTSGIWHAVILSVSSSTSLNSSQHFSSRISLLTNLVTSGIGHTPWEREIIPPKELRKYEYHHLASFFKRDGYGNFPWTSHFLSPLELAKRGFYYTGVGDAVTCYSCKLTLHNWIPSDEIIADHRRYGAEDCAAVWNYQPEHHPNTPILVPSEDEVLTGMDFPSTREDEPDTMEVQGSVKNIVTSTVTNDSGAQGNGENLANAFTGLSVTSKWKVHTLNTDENNEFAPPIHLRRCEYHRLASFFKRDKDGEFIWKNHYVSPLELARLGFFYTGRNDSVTGVTSPFGTEFQVMTLEPNTRDGHRDAHLSQVGRYIHRIFQLNKVTGQCIYSSQF